LVAEFVELVDEDILRSLAATGDRRVRGLILLDQVREFREQTGEDVDLFGIRLLICEATGHVEPLLFTGGSRSAQFEQIAITADGGGNRVSVVLALTLAQYRVQLIDRDDRTAGELSTGCLDLAIGVAQ
jgi:hypothetical protein